MKFAFFTLLLTSALLAQAPAPTQPIPFNHKQHAEASLKCSDCHASPDPGEAFTLPAASKCMNCHRAIKTDSPSIKNLAQFAAAKQEIPWVRVYQIPSWVYFSHKVHAEGGAKCEECHGPVAMRTQLSKETDLSMGGCMSCHSSHKANLDCAACHEAKS